MITSYVTPEEHRLYLSLIGPLNAASARGLLEEYDARSGGAPECCVLDLSGVTSADSSGLKIVGSLAWRTHQDGLDLKILAAGSSVEAKLLAAAHHVAAEVVSGKVAEQLRPL